ncbi:MAG TPA: GspE/PulE family protein [Candidatus Binatia bacterium]|jgi:general secretion pathway protein E|nr:GspE/PulE family protein [Candidatus Binatia bacterium]
MATKRKKPSTEDNEFETSAPKVLEDFVHEAERVDASDIHLQMHEGSASVSFRLDGVMAPPKEMPAALAERVFGRIKFLARLKTYQESLPQDGRIDKASLNARSDIRVSTYPTVTGEKIVLRLFNAAEVRTLNQLEFAKEVTTELEGFLRQTSGLLLLTGPAGSGKTTTIYACLRHLAGQGGRHIISIEDPAEQIVPGVMQTEVNEARGLDFAKAARHLLRQDPQVLVIGEIRDEETANIAIRAALTGHLVVSTLHAGSCKGVFERLLALCADHSAVASSVELVLNQRLLRRLCAACAGKGCPECLSTGYRGRLPLIEVLRLNDTLRERIATRQVEKLAAHPSLAERAKTLVLAGLTNQPEVQRVLGFE